MPSQSTDEHNLEIRSKLEHIFPSDPCIDVGVSSMYGLITSYTDEKVREARIAGLKDSIDIWNTSDSDEVFYGQIEQRIAKLNESEKK